MRNYRSVLVLVAVLLAAAVPALAQYAGDDNITWILSSDATVGWLDVQNAAGLQLLKLEINGPDVSIAGAQTAWDGKYLFVTLPAGENVDFTVTATAGKTIELKNASLIASKYEVAVAGSTATITYSGVTANALVVNLRAVSGVFAALDVANSYVVLADGTHVALALTADDARAYDYGTNMVGDLIRIWLPASIGAGEQVVLAFDVTPSFFKVTFGYQRPEPTV